MTEREWLESADPWAMAAAVEALPSRPSYRKLRLLMGATNRRMWPAFSGVERDVVAAWEEYVDGRAGFEQVLAQYRIAGGDECHPPPEDDRDALWADVILVADHAGDHEGELAAQADLIREVLGNPYRPASVDPAWLKWNGGTIPKLGQSIYEERQLPAGTLDTARYAVLADALEEAGCSDEAILSHCRGPGPHVRGCWVLDLILGKE